jgi:hypothetical protein
VSSADLTDELRLARRAVEQAQAHVRTLREQASGSRVAGRLETDVRRVVEDLDDLAAETGISAGAVFGHRGTGKGVGRSDVEQVPLPSSRRDVPEFQPECDDEGVGGGWHASLPTNETTRRWRRAQVRGGPGFRGNAAPGGADENGDGR